MTSSKQSPPAQPYAELIAQAARCCEARGHGGLWPCKENCIVCHLADALSALSQQCEAALKLCHLRDADAMDDYGYFIEREDKWVPGLATSEIRAIFSQPAESSGRAEGVK